LGLFGIDFVEYRPKLSTDGYGNDVDQFMVFCSVNTWIRHLTKMLLKLSLRVHWRDFSPFLRDSQLYPALDAIALDFNPGPG